MWLYSLICEMREMMFAAHHANPRITRTDTVLVNEARNLALTHWLLSDC